MPAATSAYGNYQPSAVDPFPIESVLAKIVGENNPAEASNLLTVYQQQNAAQKGNYEYAAQQQHDFAQQQLHQQLLDSYMKYGLEALKVPGGAPLLSKLTGGAALGGFDPTDIETNLRAQQAAGTFEKAGIGAYNAAQGGYHTNLPALTATTGGMIDAEQTPLSTINTQIREQGANARAAGKGQGIATEGFDTTDEYGLKTHHTVGKNVTPEQLRQFKEQQLGLKPIEPGRKPQPLPGRTSAQPDAGVLNGPITDDGGGASDNGAPPVTQPGNKLPPPPPFVTGLQPKPAATPAQAPVSGRVSPQNEAARVRVIQDAFLANANNPEWKRQPGYAQVVAGMKTNGGRPQVIIENGQPHFVGADGQRY